MNGRILAAALMLLVVFAFHPIAASAVYAADGSSSTKPPKPGPKPDPDPDPPPPPPKHIKSPATPTKGSSGCTPDPGQT